MKKITLQYYLFMKHLVFKITENDYFVNHYIFFFFNLLKKL